MKGIKRCLATVVLAAICVTGLVACDSKENIFLDTPQNLKIDDSEYLTWDAVEGASKYSVEIDNEVYQTEENKLDLLMLTCQPKEYEIRVKADGSAKNIYESEWSDAVTFNTDDKNEIVYTPAETYSIDDDVIISENSETDYSQCGASFVRASVKGKVVVPSEYKGITVTRIFNQSDETEYRGTAKIRSFIMPDTVKYFANRTFKTCKYLTRVKLSSSLKDIPSNAFSDCVKLSELIIPDTVTKIYANALYGCKNLKTLVLSNSLKFIDYNAFGYFDKLESLHIPASVEYIGVGNFVCCPKLTVTIDENNKNYAVDGNTIIEKSSGKVIATFG